MTIPTFKLIAEGINDQIVIENLLYGYFNSYGIEIEPLQPLRDKANRDLAENDGNWDKVLKYCESDVFKKSFQQEDNYVIIHIDSDVFLGDSIGDKYKIVFNGKDGKELSCEDLVNNIIDKLIELIGDDFYQKKKDKIIFAIAVHATECWLLPLFISDKKKGKTKNCMNLLNQALSKTKKYNFTISAKTPMYYRAISENWIKHRTFKDKHKDNPSLKIFIERLAEKNIELDEEEDW